MLLFVKMEHFHLISKKREISIEIDLLNKLMILYLQPLRGELLKLSKHFDLVAQLVEHLPFKERVLGSSPSQVTKVKSRT